MKTAPIKKIKIAPASPGVYFFLKNKTTIYIGKAVNLKQRLQNYLKATNEKTAIIGREATDLKYLELTSATEALLQEARLIKTLQPKFNYLWQDDKKYFFVGFTKELFPKLIITHQPTDSQTNWQCLIGPFTDGRTLRSTLRLLRQRYPYCTCRQNHSRPCLNSQLGNCFGFCCLKNNFQKIHIVRYRQTINQLLSAINTPSPPTLRLECYDISHLAGKEAVGAMTVMIKKNDSWQIEPNQFRKFKIKNSPSCDDPKMLSEIIRRRLRHPEWPYANLFIVDGGLIQYQTVQKLINHFFANNQETKPAVIGFAKPHQIVIGDLPAFVTKKIIQLAIQTTHRFAIGYHRLLRRKEFLT